MQITGNLSINNAEDALKYTDVISVGRGLWINADFSAPKLRYVGKSVYINKNFAAPALTYVGKSVNINAEFAVPALRYIGGYLEISADFTAPKLTHVGKSLEINADFTAPALTHVGEGLWIKADFTSPALTHVGGLELPSKAEADTNLRIIAPLALAKNALDMSDIHACATTHCIAGWACYALPGGNELERSTSWSIAGTHLLGLNATHYFHSNDEVAREFLQQYVG